MELDQIIRYRLGFLDVAVACLPKEGCSADFHDVFSISDHRTGLLVADSSRKGYEGREQASRICDTIRTQLLYKRARPEIAYREAARLHPDGEERFTTVLYVDVMVSKHKRGTANAFSAGHPYPIVHRAKGSNTRRIPRVQGQLPIGVRDPYPEHDHRTRMLRGYRPRTELFKQGDVLVLYTDGITEAMDGQRRQLGEEGLAGIVKEVVDKRRVGSPHNIIEETLERVRAYRAGPPQDDLTLLVAKMR